jgi:WG containing repeat
MAAVRLLGQQYSFIDHSGKTVIQPQFTTAGEFVDGLAPVEIHTPDGMRWGYINQEGKQTTTVNYTRAFPFSEGLAAVQTIDGKWGYINTQGTMVITPRFEQAGSFAGGVAQVYIPKGVSYIDPTGKFIWEAK